MKFSSKTLPDNIARLMPREDRVATGVKTSAEIQEAIAAKSEREFQEQCVALLRQRGVKRVVRSRTDKRTSNAVGTPDLLFCYHRRACAYECKFDKGRLSNEQGIALAEFLEDGWHVGSGNNLIAFKAWLDEI